MRNTLSAILLVVAVVCGYLFAAGGRQRSDGPFMERLLTPFRELSFSSASLLFGALLALCLSLVWLERRQVLRFQSRQYWQQALEIAFLLNVALVAGTVALLCALASGPSPAIQTVGLLFAAGLVEVFVGTVLAVILLFSWKRKAVYFSALTAHVAEVLVLGVLFVLGSSA